MYNVPWTQTPVVAPQRYITGQTPYLRRHPLSKVGFGVIFKHYSIFYTLL